MKRTMGAWALAALVLAAPGAHEVPISVFTSLSGAIEVPPNNSPATGSTQVIVDPDAHTLRIIAWFSSLLGNTAMAHIHCCTATSFAGTAGVATQVPSFVGFPVGVMSGNDDATSNLMLASSFDPAFVDLAAQGGSLAVTEANRIAGILTSTEYLDIHTAIVPSGEIRVLLTLPEPGSLALMALAVVVIALIRKKTKK